MPESPRLTRRPAPDTNGQHAYYQLIHQGTKPIPADLVHRTRPDWYLWTDGVEPGPLPEHPGESPDEVGAARRQTAGPRRPALAEGDVILVAHGHFLCVVTARHLGLTAAEGRLFQLATGTLSRLSTEHDRPVVAEWDTLP